jgi:hypothetical protein
VQRNLHILPPARPWPQALASNGGPIQTSAFCD